MIVYAIILVTPVICEAIMNDQLIEIRPGRVINLVTHRHATSTATVFLIHGLGGSSEQWREQIPQLAADYNVVTLDLLGHGKSDKPKGTDPYSFSELSCDLNAVFARCATAQNIVIGHSYGGALATSLTMDHQDNINKLLLLAPTPCQGGMPIPFLFQMPAFIMEWLRPVLEQQFQRLAFTPNDDPELMQTELLAGRRNPMYVIKAMLIGMQQMPLLNISSLTTPTFMLLGKLDGIVPPTLSANFYQPISQHQFITLDDAAHLLMLEKPQATNKLITDFLKV